MEERREQDVSLAAAPAAVVPLGGPSLDVFQIYFHLVVPFVTRIILWSNRF